MAKVLLPYSRLIRFDACNLRNRVELFHAAFGYCPDEHSTYRQWWTVTPNPYDMLWALRTTERLTRDIAIPLARSIDTPTPYLQGCKRNFFNYLRRGCPRYAISWLSWLCEDSCISNQELVKRIESLLDKAEGVQDGNLKPPSV